MRLGSLLFVAYLAIFGLCFGYPVVHIAGELRRAYVESAEEPLVDAANILATMVGRQMRDGAFDAEALYQIFDEVYAREVSAAIYDMRKQRVDLLMYITDAQGVVLFHSEGRENVGQDYSKWRDVNLTLKGTYGARIRRNPDDPSSPAVLFVAAPIVVNKTIAGVLTVVKPTTSITEFVRTTRPRIFQMAALSLGVAVLLCLLVSLWVRQQVGRLTQYANGVRNGERVAFPKLARTELLNMGEAFEKMRESLAGQAYVAQYVEALTHEIKSPLSAIRGAAEILESPTLTPEAHARFVGNIEGEALRIQDLIDRMLKLTELEAQRALPSRHAVNVTALLHTILEAVAPALQRKQLTTLLQIADDAVIEGDDFLLHLAFSNIIQNAIDFSPRNGHIQISCSHHASDLQITVDDEGPGIPDFARPRIFEKFFSLERPDTGKKSTGLGLNFVREALALHGGALSLDNRAAGGLSACVTLPKNSSLNRGVSASHSARA